MSNGDHRATHSGFSKMSDSEEKERKEEEISSDVISYENFYRTYHGHEVQYLTLIEKRLRQLKEGLIFLAGDSSLDNKFWFQNTSPALNGYETVLNPPKMKQDISYWLNSEAKNRNLNIACLNTAVEATSLNTRSCTELTPQDEFIRDNITSEDYLIVSIGGNDIALDPLYWTKFNLFTLIYCSSMSCIENYGCACPPNCCCCFNCDCNYCGGLPGCLTGLCGFPIGLGYFVDLFKNRITKYIHKLITKKKPKKIMICMIYYPDETIQTSSWADGALSLLGYNENPSKLQAIIRTIFKLATSKISIRGTEVIAFPLYEILNGKITDDYCARVEPSAQGGWKIAKALMNKIEPTRKKSNYCSTPQSPYDKESDLQEKDSPDEKSRLVRDKEYNNH